MGEGENPQVAYKHGKIIGFATGFAIGFVLGVLLPAIWAVLMKLAS